MKRLPVLLLAAVIVVALLLGAVYILFGRGMPDNARAQLNQYLAYRYTAAPSALIQNVSQATRPWFFKPDQSGATYSDTIFYRVTASYGNRVTQQVRLLSTPSTEPAYAMASMGQRILPYPPEDLWCVRLNLSDQGSALVLVALHQDLYGADWVVHELPGTWSTQERAGALAELGCAP